MLVLGLGGNQTSWVKTGTFSDDSIWSNYVCCGNCKSTVSSF